MPFPSGYVGYDTITPANPASSLTDFVYVLNANLLSTTWWANVKSDGGDVQVYNSSTEDRLPVYLHNWNYGANTGLIFFGFTGTKSTSSESIRIYAGNSGNSQPAAGDAYGQYAVFPSHFYGYWPDGLGNDLTSYGNNLTSVGSPTVGGVAGPISGSLGTQLNGTSQYGRASTALLNSTQAADMSLGGCGYHDNASLASEGSDLVCLMSNNSNRRQHLAVNVRTSLAKVTTSTGASETVTSGGGTVNSSTWYSLGGSRQNSVCYLDGTSVGTSASASAATYSPLDWNVGAARRANGTVTRYWDGIVSLCWASDTELSADWFAYTASMTTAGTQSGFYTAGGWMAESPGSQSRLALTGVGY